jgi:hypothetical protein
MRITSFAIVSLGLILGTGSVVLAEPFSNAVTYDQYNGNTPNGIPTPQFTPGLGYDLFNAVNLLYGTTALTKNEGLDPHFIAQDSSWTLTQGTQQYGSLSLIVRTAMNVNDLGFYYLVNNTIVKSSPLVHATAGFSWYGNGTVTNPYPGRDLYPPGSSFGWYIDSTDWKTGKTSTFYSDAQFNPDGYDHMVAYSLSGLAGKSLWIQPDGGLPSFEYVFSANAYLIGFEDRLFNAYGTPMLGDDDYNDLLILVDATQMNPVGTTVPEPANWLLVGVGMVCLWVTGRRIRRLS